MMLLFLIVLVLLATIVNSSEKILCGRTGNGKSYIATLLGCEARTCAGSESCTKEIQHCPNGLMDTVGLDDDGEEYEVEYKGGKIKLSGFTYPLWALFDYLEKEKIYDVEFYLVSDANNIKSGQSTKQFVDFVTNDLKCPINTVLNKFQSDDPIHVKHSANFDVVVPKYAKHVSIQGKPCMVSLSTSWRDKLVISDLKGMISQVSAENCKKFKQRLNEFNAMMNKQARDVSTKSCGYEKVVGFVPKGNSWSVSIGPISFGGGGGQQAITERLVDEDCARREKEANDAILAGNAQLHSEKMELVKTIESIESKISECSLLLANWKEL